MRTFRKNVITLASGAVVVQAIPVLTMPFLTRLYTPQDFSVLATFVAVVSVLGPLLTGRYEMAIMHSETAEEASEVATLSILLSLLISSALSLLCYCFAAPLSELLGQSSLTYSLKWLFIPLMATGLIQTFTVYLNWNKNYTGISIGRVAQNLMNSATSLLTGLAKLEGGLLYAQVAGLGLSSLFFWNRSHFKWPTISRTRLTTIAKKYIQYPLYSSPAALLDTASMSACIFILGRFYPKEVLGQFSLTHRLLLVPMVLVGTSVGQAFFQHAAESFRQGEKLHPLLVRTSKKLLFYSFPGFIVVFLLAPDIFSLIFGASWRGAGEYTRIVAVAYWIRLAVSPVSSIFMVAHRLKVGTFWQFAYFCTSVLVLGGGAFAQLSITNFLMLYTLHEAIMYGFYFWLAKKVCLERDKESV